MLLPRGAARRPICGGAGRHPRGAAAARWARQRHRPPTAHRSLASAHREVMLLGRRLAGPARTQPAATKLLTHSDFFASYKAVKSHNTAKTNTTRAIPALRRGLPALRQVLVPSARADARGGPPLRCVPLVPQCFRNHGRMQRARNALQCFRVCKLQSAKKKRAPASWCHGTAHVTFR